MLLTEMLGIELAIIQAPMAGVQGSALAAEARGHGDFSPLWCGQDASGCREVPAGVLTRELCAPARGPRRARLRGRVGALAALRR